MKESKSHKSIQVLIIFGVLFLITCAIITILHPISKPVNVLNITFMILQAVIGLSVVIISRRLTKKFFHLFAGLLYLCWSILSLLTELVLPFTIKEVWPLFGVLTGILWFIAGLIKYKRMKFGFVIPSITLFGMGIWYSLFSFEIVKLSFKSVACSLGPIFMVSIAVFLVLFFLAQQKHKELVFSDEETGVFSDEETSIRSELEDED
jgi:hypothetical protein